MSRYTSLLETATFTTGCLHPTTSEHFLSGSYLSTCLTWVDLPGDIAPVSIAFEVTGTRKPPHLVKWWCFYCILCGFIIQVVLSVTSGGVSIASFAIVVGAPIEITSASLNLAFSLCTGLVKIIKSNEK